MNIGKIQDANIANKKVLLRVDFNVSLENHDVKEKFKIEAAKETLDYLLQKNAKVAMISHWGRPVQCHPELSSGFGAGGKCHDENMSLSQIRDDAERILGVKVVFVDDCIGEKIKTGLENLVNPPAGGGEVLLLENVRFYSGEESNDAEFAKKLSENFDVFVNDAFSVSHRDQASVTGVTKFLPSYAGLRLQKEIEHLEKVINYPACPVVAIIGGAKIETKLPVIKFFENKCGNVLVGGKVANEALDEKMVFGDHIILPEDFVDGSVKSDTISDHGASRLDIGPKTQQKFRDIIKKAGMIVWNGPMGKFEEEKYAGGTQAVLEAILASKAYSFVGGGETLEILEKNNATSKISFVSTGGGAMLEYLGGGKMPGIEALR